MNSNIFRKKATAAFLNNETRGTILQVAPPSLLIFFGAVTALLATALAIVVLGRIEIPLEGRGALHPSERPTTLRAQRSGRVMSLTKARGDVVKKNDTIALFEVESETLALDSCKRDLALSKGDVASLDARGEAAGAGGGVDLLLTMERSRAHDRRASLEVRCADLERAIANARVTAPIDGVVARIDVVPGDSVREGDVVAAVASQNAKLIGSIQLPEARRAQIVAGTGVRLAFDAFPPERYGTAHGRIVRLDYAGDSASKAAGGDWAKETETIVAEVEIDTLPPAIAKAEVGMAFTGYVQTEKTGLLTLLLPSPGR